MSDERRKDPDEGALTRRQLLTGPLASLGRRMSEPAGGEFLYGRIPLSLLSQVPETVLMRMVPVATEGWNVQVCEDGVAYSIDSDHSGFVPLEPGECAAARLFDGVRTLDQVVDVLSGELGVPSRRCIEIVRTAFLTLAMREIFHPSGPLGPLPPSASS